MQTQNNKPLIVIIVILSLLLLGIVGAVAVLGIYGYGISKPTENQQDVIYIATPKIQSTAVVETWNEEGLIAIMEEPSSFEGLKVHVPHKYLTESYEKGDYIDISYDGKIIDKEIAVFHLIYEVKPHEATNESKYSDWHKDTNVTLDSTVFTETIWPAILTANGGKDNIKAEFVMGESRSYNKTYPVACTIDNGMQNTEWRVFYVQITDEGAEVLFSSPMLINLNQIS